MAEIIQFNQDSETLIAKSIDWSLRGDLYKSLLYARKAVIADSNDSSNMRLADALCESGNARYAMKIYLKLYAQGYRSEKLYVGMIKACMLMFKFKSAIKFINEGVSEGYLSQFGNKEPYDLISLEALIDSIYIRYPDASGVRNFQRKLYILGLQNATADETFINELNIFPDEHMLRFVFVNFGNIVTHEKLNAFVSNKMLEACDECLQQDPDLRLDIMATKIILLCVLGRYDEAFPMVHELVNMGMPPELDTMYQCVLAFNRSHNEEFATEYLQEILTEISNESLLITDAMINIFLNDIDRAKECLNQAYIINPDNIITVSAMRQLSKGKYKIQNVINGYYEVKLPNSVRTKLCEYVNNVLSGDCEIEDQKFFNSFIDYELRYNDKSKASELACGIIERGLNKQPIYDYLTDIEGSYALKRDIIAELVFHNPDEEIELYCVGYYKVKADSELARELPVSIRRIYSEMYATAVMYGEAEKIRNAFIDMLPHLKAMNIEDSSKKNGCAMATAIMYLYKIFGQYRVKDIVQYFVSVKANAVKLCCDRLMEACPHLTVKKRGKK